MKTLLTLFVLLFSSSVLAGDNLAGKKIFCKKISDTQINLLGFHFINDDGVLIYFHNNKSLVWRSEKYRNNLLQIEIYHITDPSNTSGVKAEGDDPTIFEIKRKDLEVNSLGSKTTWDFKPEYCELINDESLFINVFETEIEQIKSQNKI